MDPNDIRAEAPAHDYVLCGWRVRSVVALPEVMPWSGDNRPPDITIYVGSAADGFRDSERELPARFVEVTISELKGAVQVDIKDLASLVGAVGFVAILLCCGAIGTCFDCNGSGRARNKRWFRSDAQNDRAPCSQCKGTGRLRPGATLPQEMQHS